MKQYEIFNVLFRVPNGTKTQATKFVLTNENKEMYGIEKFYDDVLFRLECEHEIISYLKINEKVFIDDRTNNYIPRGKAVKCGKEEKEFREFIHTKKMVMVK